jgi:hypothetical protein
MNDLTNDHLSVWWFPKAHLFQRVSFQQDSRDQSSTNVMTFLESPDRGRASVTLITTVIIQYTKSHPTNTQPFLRSIWIFKKRQPKQYLSSRFYRELWRQILISSQWTWRGFWYNFFSFILLKSIGSQTPRPRFRHALPSPSPSVTPPPSTPETGSLHLEDFLPFDDVPFWTRGWDPKM